MKTLLCALAAGLLVACGSPPGALTPVEERAIADSIRTLITTAYDLNRTGDPVAHLMSLYPDSGEVISASGGVVTTSRDSVEAGIRAFWTNVGSNMRKPSWVWKRMFVHVASRDDAVVTATYEVPHLTPAGQPHVIAGAWTAVFQRRKGRWGIIQEHLSDVRP